MTYCVALNLDAGLVFAADTRTNAGVDHISTDRLHARGPMGLAELCSYKFVIDGTGQVRR